MCLSNICSLTDPKMFGRYIPIALLDSKPLDLRFIIFITAVIEHGSSSLEIYYSCVSWKYNSPLSVSLISSVRNHYDCYDNNIITFHNSCHSGNSIKV